MVYLLSSLVMGRRLGSRLTRARSTFYLFLVCTLYHRLKGGPFHPFLYTLLGLRALRPACRIGGTSSFAKVRDAFASNFEDGMERGSQLVVVVDGRRVVDLHGSAMNADDRDGVDGGVQYDADSLQTIMSNSKNVAAVVVAVMVRRGLLDYNAKVTKYWPEYAREGGQGPGRGGADVTVADVMRHEGGVDSLVPPMTGEELVDLDRVARKIADQPKDTAHRRRYHGLTRGFVINELVRRVDPGHRSVGQICAEELGSMVEEGGGGAECVVLFGNGKPTDGRQVAYIHHEPTAHTIINIVPKLISTGIQKLVGEEGSGSGSGSGSAFHPFTVPLEPHSLPMVVNLLTKNLAAFGFMSPVDWSTCYETGTRTWHERLMQVVDFIQWTTSVDHFNR